MNKQEFSEYLEQRLQRITDTLDKKGEEYSKDDDVFINFKKAAEITHQPTEQVAIGYALKHYVSITDILEELSTKFKPVLSICIDDDIVKKEVIKEKFGDLVNYLILIEASLLEQIKD